MGTATWFPRSARSLTTSSVEAIPQYMHAQCREAAEDNNGPTAGTTRPTSGYCLETVQGRGLDRCPSARHRRRPHARGQPDHTWRLGRRARAATA